MATTKTARRVVGQQGCDIACGSLRMAVERLEALVGNFSAGGPETGTWTAKTKAERARELAEVLNNLATGQAILAEALVGQVSS